MPDNRFSRIGESIEQYKERREGEKKLVLERKAVKKLLLGLGKAQVSLAVNRPSYKDDDGSYMTFSWLNMNYPSFPLNLVVRETWAPSIEDFFKFRTRKNSFWPVWAELTDAYRKSAKPVGCVFPFPQVTDLGMGIVHTLELPLIGVNPDLRFARLQAEVDGCTVTLEQLDSFINRLGTRWEAT